MNEESIKSLNDFIIRVSSGNAISEEETKILPEIARILVWEKSNGKCCCP